MLGCPSVRSDAPVRRLPMPASDGTYIRNRSGKTYRAADWLRVEKIHPWVLPYPVREVPFSSRFTHKASSVAGGLACIGPVMVPRSHSSNYTAYRFGRPQRALKPSLSIFWLPGWPLVPSLQVNRTQPVRLGTGEAPVCPGSAVHHAAKTRRNAASG